MTRITFSELLFIPSPSTSSPWRGCIYQGSPDSRRRKVAPPFRLPVLTGPAGLRELGRLWTQGGWAHCSDCSVGSVQFL